MKKRLARILGVYWLLDGLLTLTFGKAFVRLFRFGSRSSPYRQVIDWLLHLPGWQLRVGGLAEALLGLAALRQAPFSVREIYRTIAGGYAAIDPQWREWLYQGAHRDFDEALARVLPVGGDVLDLGSGIGANLARLRELDLPFGSYTGVDQSDAMLRQARGKFSDVQNAQFLQRSLITDALPDGPYDLITSTWVLEHLPDTRPVINMAWEQLRPGGHMVLLFETEGSTLADRLLAGMYPSLSLRRIPAAEIRSYPGKTTIERYQGVFGELTLVMIAKPE